MGSHLVSPLPLDVDAGAYAKDRRVSAKITKTTGTTLQEKLRSGQVREVLQLLRGSSPEELQRVLCEVAPTVLTNFSGKEGFQAMRFFVMRDDILPEVWIDFFCENSSHLFAKELGHDPVLQLALLECGVRSAKRRIIPSAS